MLTYISDMSYTGQVSYEKLKRSLSHNTTYKCFEIYHEPLQVTVGVRAVDQTLRFANPIRHGPTPYTPPLYRQESTESGIFGSLKTAKSRHLDLLWPCLARYPEYEPTSMGEFLLFQKVNASKDGRLWQRFGCYLFTKRIVFTRRARHTASHSGEQLAGCICIEDFLRVTRRQARLLALQLCCKRMANVHIKFCSPDDTTQWYTTQMSHWTNSTTGSSNS